MHKEKNTFRASFLIGIYRFWHGKLGLKGAGFILRFCNRFFPELEKYHLRIPKVGSLTVNFKDASGFAWLNYSLGEAGHEDGIIGAIQRFAPMKPVIWDVGANAGFFVADLTRKITDYAEIRMFEPNSGLVPCLHELAGCMPNAHVHHLAISDTSGNLVLYIPHGQSPLASSTPKPNALRVSVECTTGDGFLAQSAAADPDVVVIDTEGNDIRVVRGMSALIARKQPVIFFEHLFLNEADVLAATPDGYRHFTVDDHSGELIAGLDRKRGHNSVYLPPHSFPKL
jgi:FkbM family methyltransferase